MSEYAVLPLADYVDACEATREMTGGTEKIPSGELAGKIRSINTQEDLSAEMTAQDGLIEDIMEALEGKAAPDGGSVETCTIKITFGWVAFPAGTMIRYLPNVTAIAFTNPDGSISTHFYSPVIGSEPSNVTVEVTVIKGALFVIACSRSDVITEACVEDLRSWGMEPYTHALKVVSDGTLEFL